MLVANFVLAQYPFYHNITTEEGLPSNEIYSIIQDREGFIWIGSDVGLVRYNGVSYRQYRNEAQRSRIMAGLTMSSTGRIYGYNFSNQVFYFENDSLYELKGWQGGITNIATSPDGRFWVSGVNGLGVYNEQTGTWEPQDHNFIGASRGITFDSNGKGWFLNITSMQVGRVSNGEVNFYEVQHTKGTDFNLALYLLSVGKLGVWLMPITGGEVYKFDGNAFVPFSSRGLNSIIGGRKSNLMLQMPDERLWFCTFSGAVVYDPATDSTEVLYDGVSISNVMFGREGGIWLTSLHKGLLYIPDMRFLHWGTTNSVLPSNNITQLDIKGDELYYATSDGYFGQMDLTSKVLQNHYLGVGADINGLYYDTVTHSLWFNSSTKLYEWNKSILNELDYKAPAVKSIVRAGTQVYYTASFGLYVTDTLLGRGDIEKPIEVWCREMVYQPASEKLWVASDSGMWLLDAPNTSIDTLLLPGRQVISIAEDAQGRIYGILFTGQIISLENDLSVHFIATLPNNANGADLEVVGNKLWVATNQGVMVYNLETDSWLIIDKVIGLASNNVKAIRPHKNQMWLATGNGLQALPLDYAYDRLATRAFLTQLTVNGKVHDMYQPLQLDYNDVLGFVPEAAAYSSMGQFQFAYRTLQGDTTWQLLPSNTQQFSLPGISPGKFTLQLKVVDHSGRDSENVISINGDMQPPFWQRWWFYGLVSAAGLFLGYIGFRYRLRIIKQQQLQQLERMQLENELELSQQAALKAQMNPHFIFNVLNSIKSYIYENDKKSAAEYLSTFAKLIRRILTMSSEPHVTLEEELEALELYIQLEAMLLEPPFDYGITIAPAIEPHSIRLPSLLIQPYIENAFKHGLRHQQGEKHLAISINLLPAAELQVTIDDNGVGRIVAAQLNKDRLPGHQSFATTANSKRLELLNQNKAESVNVVYIDKTDELGKPLGTKVVITIKIA